MEIYFYCSYEHSQRGFFLTRLEGEGLVPVEGEGLAPPPKAVRDFFSYDRYTFLWRDLVDPGGKAWQRPACTGGFCGMRELRGRMSDGRNGVVNMAFLAEPGERKALRRTILAVLGDYDGFRANLFRWLSVGGEWGYELDGGAFRAWLNRCAVADRLRLTDAAGGGAAELLPLLQKSGSPLLERDTLRLAACTCSWEEIRPTLGDHVSWRIKPKGVLTEQAFAEAFTGRGPVWVMENSAPL